MTAAKRIAIVADKPFSPQYNTLLGSFYDAGIELFCAVGEFASQWEAAMDSYLVDPAREYRFMATTSHPDGTIKDVCELVFMAMDQKRLRP